MAETPRVVFFGSGPVAADSLRLLAAHCDIEAVITKPQPAHHKAVFPVLTTAAELGFSVHTVSGKQELSELFTSRPFASRLGIIIDFGFIVNQDVIDYFPLGIINSHFSLLPELRGADPISFAVLSGQPETGVSLMLITAGMDEGPLLAQATYALPPDITTPQLTDALVTVSDDSLRRIVPLYINGSTHPAPQEQVALPGHDTVSYTRKLAKQDGVLDFTKSAAQLEREVRAYIEWPKSRTSVSAGTNTREIVITAAHVLASDHNTHVGTKAPGSVWKDGKQFGFYTSDGILVVDKLKPAGKAEMTAQGFLAGYSPLLAAG